MKRVILITNIFPYKTGEEFLETEIKYYKNYPEIEFIILPINKSSETRIIDKNIKIDNYLNTQLAYKKFHKLKIIFNILLRKIFYKELFTKNIFNLKSIKILVSSLSKYMNFLIIFDSYFKSFNNLENTIVYTYWNKEESYALQTLKNKYKYKLISRIHGFDIYQERHFNNYLPLKNQFIKDIDKIFTITPSANKYLEETYKFSPNKLILSRLGVEDKSIISDKSKKNMFHIVSCSSLTKIKRVDKIIASLKMLGENSLELNFKWTHIGDGILKKELIIYAEKKLSHISNVEYNFLGHLDNKDVYQFYKKEKVDVFINVSESEGVPVSIMEAMSCHIPVIAPNIGGISDMIENNQNGILLSEYCDNNEIFTALCNIDLFKETRVRDNSYKTFLEKYNSEKNYVNFLNKVINL